MAPHIRAGSASLSSDRIGLPSQKLLGIVLHKDGHFTIITGKKRPLTEDAIGDMLDVVCLATTQR
jgi:hypothetical protein